MSLPRSALFVAAPLAALALSPLAAGPAQQDAPEPPALRWRPDLDAALDEARAARKPLLVVFRCPHDKASAALDDALLRPQDPELRRLLAERFVTARVHSLKGVDLDLFAFDYDLTLAAVVVDPLTRATRTRWGTRDGESATARLSVAGLANALRAVADVPFGSGMGPRGVTRLERAPGFVGTKRAKEPCYHCHYAHDARIAQERAAGRFRKASLWMYPHPENVGLTLDLQRNNVVASVAKDGAAEKAGVRAGDVIERAGATRVHTAADLQWALNYLEERDTVTLALVRGGGERVEATLKPRKGWRETDISWRASQGAVPPLVGIWESPLTDEERAAAKVEPGRLALRITFVFEGERWAKTYGDLRKGDVILDVDGKRLPRMAARQFHAWFRMHQEVGDTARFSVLRDGKRLDVRVPCVDVAFD